LNLNQNYFEIQPNQTTNISFIIFSSVDSPYIIKSWGVFGNFEDEFNLTKNQYYIYNFSQTFQISNDYQTSYLNFIFNSTNYPKPIIYKVEAEDEMVVGKKYRVGLYGRNIEEAKVNLKFNNTLVSSFSLQNKSEEYWEGEISFDRMVDSLEFVAKNEYGEKVFLKNVKVKGIDLNLQNILLPAIKLNSPNLIFLVDFGTELPIQLNYSINKISLNSSNITYDVSLVDENYNVVVDKARKLYLIITPYNTGRGMFYVNLSSPFFNSQNILVDFISTQNFYPPQQNISLYDRIVYCELKGKEILNSTYECKFYVPYNYDIGRLKDVEYEFLRQSYETKINNLNEKLNSTTIQRNVLLIGIFILALAFLIYKYRERLIILWH
jgi:hypothetical protein